MTILAKASPLNGRILQGEPACLQVFYRKATICWLTLLCLLTLVVPSRAALQFDVFCGYENTIREAAWFPITCEIFNDGPSFNAIIEISSNTSDQVRQIPIELPTNTRKRLTIPMFAAGNRFNSRWNARLIDSNGKVRDERLEQQTRFLLQESTLLGAIPRTFGGLPSFPEIKGSRSELQPEVARIQVEQFPDNPLALEGLSALYLNSEKAIELRAEQVNAIIAWVRGGGHLIVAAEQLGDINATPWLKQFLPVDLVDTVSAAVHNDVVAWIRRGEDSGAVAPRRAVGVNRLQAEVNVYRNLPADEGYRDIEVPVVTGNLKDGSVLIAGTKAPLAVQAPRGRGKVTLLAFSPEREPFRSWKQRGYFYSKLADVPPEIYNLGNQGIHGGYSMDGIFGALIDSRQIKKLPVTWLLVLLLVYLVVIGPFDQWWLKKIGKQMLTWITFPAYVVLFSLLIYFIGYKLRAGETEWNELSVVDVFPRGDKVDLRGRTFISIYSSANGWYKLSGQQGYATLRPELFDLYGGGRESSKVKIVQPGNSYQAEVFVPVWTSLLFVNDWFKTNDTPFLASITGPEENRTVEIGNLLDQPLKEVRLVVDGRVHEVGEIGSGERKSFSLSPDKGQPLDEYVQLHGSYFTRAVENRRNPLGDHAGGHLENRPLTAFVASFTQYIDSWSQHTQRGFIAPPGLDLSPQVRRGDAAIFAFLAGETLSNEINQFRPPRLRRDTLLRLVLPTPKSSERI